ncbi:hypothetical protein [Nocardia carnea]|uniref:hypothetical protein n=1 Tax=Nocardia carnea TaxID=37328 RepID=UPI00245640A3|nr:hypothetical protein [Nocardia carnea]
MGSDGEDARRGSRRRPVVVAEALAARKARRLERAARARERERRINAAEKEFLTAWETIETCNHDLGEELAALEQRAQQARERAGELIAAAEQKQVDAARRIRAERCTIDEVAEILQISSQRARSMLVEKRRPRSSADASGRAGRGGRDGAPPLDAAPVTAAEAEVASPSVDGAWAQQAPAPG